jgi:hypothetical protein
MTVILSIKSKLIVLFALPFIIFSLSCSMGSNVESIKPSTFGARIYSSLSAISDLNARRQAYSNLQALERYEYWKIRFSTFITRSHLSSKQVDQVNELASVITLDYFENADIKSVFNTVIIPKWIKKNEKLFSSYETFDLLFSVNPERSSAAIMNIKNNSKNASYNTLLVEQELGGGGISCICALGSSYTCPFWTFFPITVHYYTCEKIGTASCTESVRGCGALMDDACDGNFCPAFNPNP